MNWALFGLRDCGRLFGFDRSGSVTITFGVLAIPILALLIGAIDYSRALSVKFSLQQSADAAVEAAADNLGGGDKRAEMAFAAHFKANLPEKLRDTPYDLSLDAKKGTVQVAIKKPVPTTIVSLIGVNAFNVAVNAKAKRRELNAPLAIGNAPAQADLPPEIRDAARDAQRQLQDALQEARRRGAPIQMPSEAELRRLGEQLKRQLGNRY